MGRVDVTAVRTARVLRSMARVPFWQLWEESRAAMLAVKKTGSIRAAAKLLGWSRDKTDRRYKWWQDAVGHAFAHGRIHGHKTRTGFRSATGEGTGRRAGTRQYRTHHRQRSAGKLPGRPLPDRLPGRQAQALTPSIDRRVAQAVGGSWLRCLCALGAVRGAQSPGPSNGEEPIWAWVSP